ncbi:MAG TPA: hypothetical protein VG756_28065 [Pseudonocardiaceae bacterium]|jgi:hypothetical protein|nr:hypothetical protein [Pseudonocardiaceae bacterium]
MSSEKPGGDEPYRLPTPDLTVFGEDESTTAEHRAEPAGGDEHHGAHPGDEVLGHGVLGRDETVENFSGAPGEQPTVEQEHPRGRMTFQDEHTARHQPTLAEQRARQQAEAEAGRAEEQRVEDEFAAARKRQVRRRVLIGGAVVVVAAGIIGSQYLFQSTTTANCVGADQSDQNSVVNDQYCDQAYVQSHGGYVSNGIIFLPIGSGGFRQYRYYYGGSVSSGHVSGGSYTAPSSGSLKTGSGKSISRGGFGVTSGGSGSSGGGSDEGGSSGSHSGSSGGKSGGS